MITQPTIESPDSIVQLVQSSVILIVDDSSLQREYLYRLLQKAGYRIHTASGGREALTSIAHDPPDLVLLDIEMPEMDGWDVCRAIKKDPQARDIPVLFITSLDDEVSKLEGFQMGAADYITKPYATTEILARVKTHLGLHIALRIVREQNTELEKILSHQTRERIRFERQATFGQLVQGIVHNINSPLASILGYIQLLNQDLQAFQQDVQKDTSPSTAHSTPSTSKFSKHLANLNRSAGRLLDIVNSLLAKSRSDQTDEFQYVDINQILYLEINFFGADDRFKMLPHTDITLAAAPLFTTVISSQISQVFANLLNNALDALHARQEPRLKIQSGRENRTIWFSITDNGPGIAQDALPHIFDAFYTTKSVKAQDQGSGAPVGTGLGLWTCREMLKGHNGSIDVQSGEGHGTTFTVRLPELTHEEHAGIANTSRSSILHSALPHSS